MNKTSHFACQSCPSQMSRVREWIRHSASEFGFDEDTIPQLVLAVDEACTNIIRHSYHGKTDCKIELSVNSDGNTWEVKLRDYGQKCDASKLKSRNLDDVRPGGLGLYFIQQAFDEVHFEDQTSEDGNLLILRKKKEKALKPNAAPSNTKNKGKI